MLPFSVIHSKLAKIPAPTNLLALDPGETTGWAYFEITDLKECGQLDTKDQDNMVGAIQELLARTKPAICVIEDYRVYGWKAKDHSWAELHTPKLIGVIRALCYLQKIPTVLQMAYQAKNFVTDDKLKAWGMYSKGQRHARDAIRHGCSYMLFAKPEKLKAINLNAIKGTSNG